ncbi:carboxy-terminal processing protease [Jejuia pallidilutea]|uniref:Carboxy-terminal processing protease n=1 Tax=Jejuia pallidilutea TaxID=504487 RepID=A0A090VZV8_9FLAO|nr:carboxy-terminal processing protease [Jejuia pallidilutea]
MAAFFPDVTINKVKNTTITKAILNSDLIFDFATDYYYKNPSLDIDNFKLTDTDFKDFKTFLENNNFTFTTDTEKALYKAYETSIKENLNNDIKADYDALISGLRNSKKQAIDAHKDFILKSLTEEIVKRYAYREGLYEYYKANDAHIKKSTQILGNTMTYMDYLR